ETAFHAAAAKQDGDTTLDAGTESLPFLERRTFFVGSALWRLLPSTLRNGDQRDTGLLTDMLVLRAGETAIRPIPLGRMAEELLMTLERGGHVLLVIGVSF